MIALRFLLSTAAGAGLYLWAYHPWLPYSMRERSQTGTGMLMVMAGAFACGLLLGRGEHQVRYLIAAAFLGAMWLANAVVIAADWHFDPTSHNLLPFEFIILAFLGSPAFLGAALSGGNKKGGAQAPPRSESTQE